ncbi:hypothetical protein PDESU_05385 [Pontiella desulfatans]|uniref:TonB-dependent receptor-like beta-barrel domain-containing protein n=1 Tax=Pontiella desulfatans TaxID=2750659 RepID=A0A6C2UAA9_PONDE|nr:TonB-dependent receptor [Pontiella desulfatans]VGO16793.1 hypothetical protein PDESU_05385 [Pontiella desulfatans]
MKPFLPALFLTSCCLADFADLRTIEHGLREDPGVVVNSQGKAQHDLSIRGSGYTGAGVSLNGLNLKVPYSAHFGSELPLPGNLFLEPEVRTGLDNASGSLAGTVAYTTAPREEQTQDSMGLGSKEQYQATLFGSSEYFGGVIDWEKARKIDHGKNDLEREDTGIFVQFPAGGWVFDILSTLRTKEFGAQGYYGIPKQVYAEQRTDDFLTFFSATKGELDDAFFRTSASLREFDDEYAIPSELFTNEVVSRHGAVMAEGRTLEIQHIALNLRGDLEYERISGDVGTHDRLRGSVMVLPEVRFERVVFKAGLNSVFQSDESAEWLPLAGIDWLASDNGTVYASYSETERQPDYETLYYNGPYRTGNPLLEQQHSQNTELGFRQFLSASLDWKIAGFHRRMDHASDWIGGVATDLGTLKVAGIDTGIGFYPTENVRLTAYYQWVHKDNELTGGLYETDYPEHLLNLSAQWRFLDEYTLQFAQTTRWQTENPARTGSDFGAEASLGLHWEPRFANNVRLSFLVDNLWGSNFEAIPGLEPRPTTASAGMAVRW